MDGKKKITSYFCYKCRAYMEAFFDLDTLLYEGTLAERAVIRHPAVERDDPIAPHDSHPTVRRSPRDRHPTQSAPHGNATSTVKNRNASLPPGGTSCHESESFALPSGLMRGINEFPTPSAEWLNSNIGLPPST